MTNDRRAVFAVYRKQKRAEQAKTSLLQAGFNDSQICVLSSPSRSEMYFHELVRTSWRLGAKIGATVGGSAFLVIGVALSLNIIALPGHHTYHMSPIAARFILTFAGVSFGTLLGSLIGALIGAGTPEPAGQRYASYAQAGGSVLSIEVNGNEDFRRAAILLEQAGGSDITEMNEKKGWRIIHEQLYEQSRPAIVTKQDRGT